MKKGIIAFACAVLFCAFALHIFSAQDTQSMQSKSWYCTRNAEHKQPAVGADIAFAETLGAYYVDRAHGDDSEEKVLYLTFDCGYENGNVSKILDTLNEKKVSAAFFVLSNFIIKNTDVVKRMADEGHLVCNHTSKHLDMSKMQSLEEFSCELQKLEKTYREYTGREIDKYFRPPEGRFNESTLKYAAQMGYTTVFWSFAYEDWNNESQPSAEAAKKKIMDNIHNGAIILLHPTSATNAEILEYVIDECREMGYRFASLDELTK